MIFICLHKSENAWSDINDRIEQDPNPDHPVPINRDEPHVQCVFEIEWPPKKPRGHYNTFEGHRGEMQQVNAQDRPHDGTVGVVVPLEMQRWKFPKAQSDRCRAEENAQDPIKIQPPMHGWDLRGSAFGDTYRHATKPEQEQVQRRDQKVGSRIVKNREKVHARRRPALEISAQIKITRDENAEHGGLDYQEQQ